MGHAQSHSVEDGQGTLSESTPLPSPGSQKSASFLSVQAQTDSYRLGSQSLEELEQLASARGIRIPDCPDVVREDVLISLLQAFDLGAASAASTPGALAKFSDSSESSAPSASASVLNVLQKIRDAPGHMGCDIGGTLVKMVLALPPDKAPSYNFPPFFGVSGRTHDQLELDLNFGDGRRFTLRFLSGTTAQMEQAVQHLSMRRQDSWKKFEVLESSESEEEASTDISQEADVMTPPCRLVRLHSDWSDEVFSSSTGPIRRMATAGGGACKFAPLFQDALRVELVPVKELSAVVDGLLLLSNHRHLAASKDNPNSDLFTLDDNGDSIPLPWPTPLFPLIVVNIGSGVSILRVDSEKEGDFVRVGGTACGGGTFLGLARALTSAKTFDEALALASAGDATRADKLVSDIYGEDGCANLGLRASLTASNFAKLSDHPMGASSCTEKDLARSLLQMVTQQSVLLAIAYAREAGCINRVFFVGGFVDEPNKIARTAIAANLRSLGGCAYFLRHSDFLGSLGSLKWALKVLEDEQGASSSGQAL